MEPLANKVTRTKANQRHQQYNRRTHRLWWATPRAELTAHMNNGQFPMDDRRSHQIRAYNKLLEQQTRTANLIPAGEIKGAVRVGIASRFTWVVQKRSVQQVEDDDVFCNVLSISLRLTRWYWNINQGEKHELTNDMMKRAKGEGIVRYSKSKLDDFLRAKYEHMMGGSGLMASCRFSRGWKWKATQDAGSSSGSLRGPPDNEGHAKRYRHADGRYFGPLVEWLPVAVATDNKKWGTVSPPLLGSALRGAEGWETAYAFRGV